MEGKTKRTRIKDLWPLFSEWVEQAFTVHPWLVHVIFLFLINWILLLSLYLSCYRVPCIIESPFTFITRLSPYIPYQKEVRFLPTMTHSCPGTLRAKPKEWKSALHCNQAYRDLTFDPSITAMATHFLNWATAQVFFFILWMLILCQYSHRGSLCQSLPESARLWRYTSLKNNSRILAIVPHSLGWACERLPAPAPCCILTSETSPLPKQQKC